jgi:hypothetical protein
VDLCIRDFGGAKQYRSLWSTQYQSLHGIVFVVDAADADRLPEVRVFRMVGSVRVLLLSSATLVRVRCGHRARVSCQASAFRSLTHTRTRTRTHTGLPASFAGRARVCGWVGGWVPSPTLSAHNTPTDGPTDGRTTRKRTNEPTTCTQAASEFKRVLADKALAAREKIVLLVLANKSDLPQVGG